MELIFVAKPFTIAQNVLNLLLSQTFSNRTTKLLLPQIKYDFEMFELWTIRFSDATQMWAKMSRYFSTFSEWRKSAMEFY